MVLSRRRLLGSSLAASALLGAPGLIKGAAAQGKKISYIAPFAYQMSFAAELNAVAGGHHTRHGLDVEMLPGRGTAMALQQLLAERALFGRSGGIDIAQANEKGLPVVGIATIVQGSNFWVVSTEAKPIRSVKDISGKTIGVVSVKGATEHILDMMLAKNGLVPEQTQRQAVGNAPSAYALVSAGRIDAMIVSTPTVSLLREAGEKFVAWNTDQEFRQPGEVYITLRSTLEKEPDTVIRFLRGLRNSTRELLAADNEAKREAIVVRLNGKFSVEGGDKPAAAAKTLVDAQKLWLGEGPENVLRNSPARWNELIQAMLGAKLLEKPVDPTTLYTNRFIDEALKA